MLYLWDRFEDMSEDEITQLRVLGERYCQPVARHVPVGANA